MSIGDSLSDDRYKIIKRLGTNSKSHDVVFLVEDTKSYNEKYRIKKFSNSFSNSDIVF